MASLFRIILSSTIENVLPMGRALREIGYETYIFDASIKSSIDTFLFKPANKILWNLRLQDKSSSLGSRSLFCNKNYRGQKVSEAIKEFGPECIIFEIGFKPPVSVLQEAREKGIKIGGWWTMSARWIALDQEEKDYYDVFFSFVKEQADYARAQGYNACYLPHGINHYLYKPVSLTAAEKTKYYSDVIFVGGWKKTRQAVMDSLNNRVKLAVYGPGWRRRNALRFPFLRSIKGGGLYGQQLVKHYIASKIVLNINAWFTEKPYGLNQRVFDVPACGAFLMTDYVEGLDSYYKLGEEIETYKDTEELVDKVTFYLKNETARERIALKGFERSGKMPTLLDQAERMAQALGLPSPRRGH
jgi:spore maturation protein CgeB